MTYAPRRYASAPFFLLRERLHWCRLHPLSPSLRLLLFPSCFFTTVTLSVCPARLARPCQCPASHNARSSALSTAFEEVRTHEKSLLQSASLHPLQASPCLGRVERAHSTGQPRL